MPRETLLSRVNEHANLPTMAEDQEDDYLYEQFAGRAGNWELNQKPRPFHHPGRLIAGVIYNVICWVCMGSLVWFGYEYHQTDDRQWMVYALIAVITLIIFQIARYSNGLGTHCPLCHGTPLFEKRCHKHRFANKFLFFGHRASTVLSILTRGKFNCMYCGTPFRIKK